MSVRGLRQGSQCSKILTMLQRGGVMTAAKAVRLFECYRLSERIRELRRYGYRIHSTMVKLPSGKRCACYAMDL